MLTKSRRNPNMLTMYSLYDCDAWRTSESMSLEFETLDKQKMNDKIKEIIESDPDTFSQHIQDYNIDLDNDDLVDRVQNQVIDYLYLEIREIDPENKTVELI